MDHLTILQCRNSALATELRLVKEQLAQAHTSTNYLLSTITKQQAQHDRESMTQLQGRLNEALAENAQQRGHTIPQHHLIDRPRAERSPRQRALTHQLQSIVPPSPPFTDEQGLASPCCGVGTDNDDLLSFEGGEGGTVNNFSSSTSQLANLPAYLTHKHVPSLLDAPSPLTGHHDSAALTTVGLGITGVPSTQQPIITPPKDAEGGHTITHADGTTSFISLTPESSFPTPPQFNRSSPPNHAPSHPRYENFGHWERAHLLGQAVFIEDMDDEEYLALWKDLEKRRGKHSAAEWQGYYERAIRPVFRKQEAAKAAKAEALAAAKEAGGDNDEKGAASVTEGDDADVSGESSESKGSEVVEESVDNEADVSGESSESKGGEAFEEDEVNEADGSEHSPDCDDFESQEEKAIEQNITPVGKAREIQVVQASTKVVANASADDTASPKNKETSTTTSEAEPGLEGLLASRWAPKAAALPKPEVAETNNHTESISQDNFANLPTVEEFCAEQELLKKQAAIILSQRPTQHDPNTPTPLHPTTSLVPSGSGPTPPARGPRPRYNNRDGPTREPFIDPRPPCCHYPMHVDELFHSNFSASAKHDASVLRTVMISNLPPNVTLAEVLDQIHSGKILATTYLPLSELLRKSGVMVNAVLVTFLYAGDAKKFVEKCEKELLLFYDEKWEQWVKATVTHIQSPVRGAPGGLSIRQIREEGLSRVVYLIDDGVIEEPASVVSKVMSVLAQRSRGGDFEGVRYPVKMGRGGDGILGFEFGGIGDAVVMRRGLEVLWGEFGGMGRGYLGDPCEAKVGGVCGEGGVEGGVEGGGDGDVVERDGDERQVVMPHVQAGGEQDVSSTAAITNTPDEVETAMTAYTTQKPAISTPTSTQLSSPLMATAPSTPVPAVPRTTPWGPAGDLEAAKAFMASATREGARQRPKGRRGGDGGEVGYDEEAMREGEAFGVEGTPSPKYTPPATTTLATCIMNQQSSNYTPYPPPPPQQGVAYAYPTNTYSPYPPYTAQQQLPGVQQQQQPYFRAFDHGVQQQIPIQQQQQNLVQQQQQQQPRRQQQVQNAQHVPQAQMQQQSGIGIGIGHPPPGSGPPPAQEDLEDQLRTALQNSNDQTDNEHNSEAGEDDPNNAEGGEPEDEGAIFNLPPPPEGNYPSVEDLESTVHAWTLEHGYEVVRRASKKNANGVIYKRYYHCSKHGKLANTGKLTAATRQRANRKTNRQNCPMSMAVVAVDPSNPEGEWQIRHRKTHHNHGPMEAVTLAGHRRRARMGGVEKAVDGLFAIGTPTSQVVQFLQRTNPEGLFTRTDVANMKLKYKKFGTCVHLKDQFARDPDRALGLPSACLRCREKKVRCNSVRPQCQNCQLANEQCMYDHEPGQAAMFNDTPGGADGQEDSGMMGDDGSPLLQTTPTTSGRRKQPRTDLGVRRAAAEQILQDLQSFQNEHVKPKRLDLNSSLWRFWRIRVVGMGIVINLSRD
ncbi:hypothetical protein LTR56_008427 [Elasticomyces elasticus]|nr:hypothetical protein LTR56_008427 [Elasticomyces elasticus]